MDISWQYGVPSLLALICLALVIWTLAIWSAVTKRRERLRKTSDTARRPAVSDGKRD